MGWLTARLQQMYAYAGLALEPSRNESPDHAAVELEFMAYLCGQEAAGWTEADRDAAIRALKQQRSFLRHHLGRWFGDFARRVQASTDEPLYAAAGEAADAFIQHDRDLVEVIIGEIDLLVCSASGAGSTAGDRATERG
jgi:anaerobic sulfite reductase subunit A